MIVIDGKSCSTKLRENLAKKVADLKEKHNIVPGLAVVIIGEDSASQIYVRNKVKGASEVGMNSVNVVLDENITQQQAEEEVIKLANRKDIDGIIVQLPLPKKFNSENILRHIPANKDVDGLCAENLGKLVKGEKTLVSCTPYGIMELLKEYNVEIAGKNAVVVGRSNMVGKPIASLLLNENATVTICHSKTKNIENFTKNADILVVAVGRKNYITGDMIKNGAVVIDVGINRDGSKIYGDVDFETAKNVASYITPVPGGVGPMTVSMLLKNSYIACLRNNNLDGIYW